MSVIELVVYASFATSVAVTFAAIALADLRDEGLIGLFECVLTLAFIVAAIAIPLT